MVEKDTEVKSGVDEFIEASDAFYRHLAEILHLEINNGSVDLVRLRELSELVKINSMSIKSQREDAEKGKKKEKGEKVKQGSRIDQMADRQREN